MASKVDIFNRALQKVGAKRVTAPDQDSVNARACNAAYEHVRDALLRAHVWNFAIKRAQLAADATAPSWGRTNSFTLPSDFIRKADPYPEDVVGTDDWQIEDGKILTDDASPLYLRYVYRVTDTTKFDSLFVELLATMLALEICEELTQSNTKKADLEARVKEVLREARRTNAFEGVPQVPPEDDFITARY